MKITVKFFASFREKYKKDTIFFELSDEQMPTAEQVWQQITGDELPANALVAINQTYADVTTLVAHGDELGFFPPVTGG